MFLQEISIKQKGEENIYRFKKTQETQAKQCADLI